LCDEQALQSKTQNHLSQDSIYSGQAILCLATGEHFPEHFKACQAITAHFLADIIGHKPLQSRKLWQHLGLN